MNSKRIQYIEGFSLIEVLLLIIITGILASVAMQSLSSTMDESRRVITEREMEVLAKAIVGDPSIMQNGKRADFGYVGDIGAFPPNLQALIQNPGLGTWNGPYIEHGFTQDSTGFKTDEWGQLYAYTGGMSIASSGSGATISKKLANNSNDYLLNSFTGLIRDSDNNPPGADYLDSIDIVVTIPDGAGSTLSKTYSPDRFGLFTLDSVPAGIYPLRIIYTPMADTLLTFLTVLPRHKYEQKYKYASNYFADTSGAGGGAPLALSIGQSRTLGGLSINDEDIAFYDRGADTSRLLLDGSNIFTGNENVDAMHLLLDSSYLLSTSSPAEIGGASFNEDDIVFYDPSADTASIILYGDSLFALPENINAIHLIDSTHILLVTDGVSTIGTDSYQSHDIVQYFIDDDSANLYFDGNTAFGGAADVNAVHVLGDGHIILSVSDAGRTIGSTTFGQEDMVEYDPTSGTATMYFDGNEYFTQFPTDVNAIHVGDGSGTVYSAPAGPAGAAGHWRFDETNGSTAEDISGNMNHGTLYVNDTTAVWVAGTINGAIEFNGTNEYVQIPHADNLNGDTALSYCTWINPHTWSGSIRQVMAKSVHGGGSGRVQMGIFSEGGLLYGRVETNSGRQNIFAALPTINAWCHVAVVFDTVCLSIYINGALANSVTYSSTTLRQNTDPLCISKRVGTSQYYFDGLIDDVRVYTRALNAAEILALYNMGN